MWSRVHHAFCSSQNCGFWFLTTRCMPVSFSLLSSLCPEMMDMLYLTQVRERGHIFLSLSFSSSPTTQRHTFAWSKIVAVDSSQPDLCVLWFFLSFLPSFFFLGSFLSFSFTLSYTCVARAKIMALDSSQPDVCQFSLSLSLFSLFSFYSQTSTQRVRISFACTHNDSPVHCSCSCSISCSSSCSSSSFSLPLMFGLHPSLLLLIPLILLRMLELFDGLTRISSSRYECTHMP